MYRKGEKTILIKDTLWPPPAWAFTYLTGNPGSWLQFTIFWRVLGVGGIWGIYKPEPTHLEGVKIVACRELWYKGVMGRKKKGPKWRRTQFWKRSTATQRHPGKKVLCLRSLKRGGAGLARELWSDKGTCREMGIKGLCLNKRIPSVFTRFFCPGPFVLLRTMLNWLFCLPSNSLVTSTAVAVNQTSSIAEELYIDQAKVFPFKAHLL